MSNTTEFGGFELNQSYAVPFMMRYDAQVVISPLRDGGDKNEAGSHLDEWLRGGGLQELIVSAEMVGEYTWFYGKTVAVDRIDPEGPWEKENLHPIEMWTASDALDFPDDEPPYYQIALNNVTRELA